jgi:hypothetical protein
VSGLSWTLEGERLSLWEWRGAERLPLRLGIATGNVLSIRAAGLLSNLYRDRGDSELADLLGDARYQWLQTPEGLESVIVGQPREEEL